MSKTAATPEDNTPQKVEKKEGVLAKIRAKSKLPDVDPENYILLAVTEDELVEAVESYSNDTIRVFDLEKASVPSGGGKQFQVTGGEVDVLDSIRGFILDIRPWRAYYKETFATTGGGTPPDCSSNDCVTGMGDRGIADEQSTGPHDCATCPWAQFGSAKDEKGDPAPGQACNEMRVIFLLPPDSVMPMMVVAPPTSIQAVQSFKNSLRGRMIPLYSVEVELTLDVDKNKKGVKYSKITIARTGKVSEANLDRMRVWSESMKKSLGGMETSQQVEYRAPEQVEAPQEDAAAAT